MLLSIFFVINKQFLEIKHYLLENLLKQENCK